MKPRATRTALAVITALVSLAASTTLLRAGARYTITDLGTLGGTVSEAFGIKASGQVVGTSATASGSYHAFLYDNGTMSDLDLTGTSGTARAVNPSGQIGGYYYDGSYQGFIDTNGQVTELGNLGGDYTVVYGLNATGQACGSSMTASNDEHAFFYSGGTMTDINAFGGEYSSARGINASGQVVGFAYLASGTFHAFVRTGSINTDLGTLGGSYSQASAINDAGSVVGQAYLAGNVKAHAFLGTGSGALQDLGELGDNYSEALALNSTASQIVGRAAVPNHTGYIVDHAFIYMNGRMRDLNRMIDRGSGWILTEATGINDAGQITGTGTIHGESHAFLLDPR